jgi:WhiB family redox-sensing transcriptional regulator
MATFWDERALCAQTDPDLWFPEKGGPVDKAKQICARCPVQLNCARAGKDERWGVWGGLSSEDRLKERRKRHGQTQEQIAS